MLAYLIVWAAYISWDTMVSTFMTPLPASLRVSFDCPYGERLKAELQSYCGAAIEVPMQCILNAT